MYNLCAALQRSVREYRLATGGEPLDIFSDKSFNFFHQVFDSEMKELQASGIGVKSKQAEPMTLSKEKLWQEGLLGDHSPSVLLY